MAIEVLYFDGCPNYEALVPHLRELLDHAGVKAEVELRRIESEQDARRLRFLGSPTVRVEGRDVESGARARVDYGLKCRIYRTPDGIAGVPPDKLILAALGEQIPEVESGHCDNRPAPTTPDILSGRSLAERLVGCPTGLRDLHRSVLRSFVAGQPPDAEELRRRAGELGVGLEEARRELERRDVLWLDPETGSVAVAYPFSGAETPHHVNLAASGTPTFAMCAIDALGIPFLACQPATIRSRDPSTADAIEVRIDPVGGREWKPHGAAVMAAVSGDGPSARCCCPHVNFVTSRERGQELLRDTVLSGGGVLEMREAIDLGQRIFGALL